MNARSQNVGRSVDKLRSDVECNAGLIEVVACGRSAVPALRVLLFAREPSGLFQARCRAIDALAALKAYDVLIDYLKADHAAADPIQRLGDDAVINYAAWAVARTREDSVFELLLRLARRPSLSGVIGALGAYGRVEAIPALIEALEEDVSRNVAEFMLRRLGTVAGEALVESACCRRPTPDRESESSRRRRRSSLSLLNEIGLGREAMPRLTPLISDEDDKVAVLACKLCLPYASPDTRREIGERLTRMLAHADWLLREEIETCLASLGPIQEKPGTAGVH